jgi:hypothetical protein
MKKLFAIAIFIIRIQLGDSEKIESSVGKLSIEENNSKNGALYQEFLKYGKSAIPYLIRDIYKNKTNYGCIFRPLNSNLKILVNYDGVFDAYVIEVILSTTKLSEAAIRQNKNNLFTRNIIIKTGDPTPLEYTDLLNIKKIYNTWWERSKGKSIEALRQEWKNNKRPLSGSKYSWY